MVLVNGGVKGASGINPVLDCRPKILFPARLTDVPRRITPQTAVPLDQNSLALRARCGVVDDSVVPSMVLVNGGVKGASHSQSSNSLAP